MNMEGGVPFMPKNLITFHTSKLAACTIGVSSSLYCCLISLCTTLIKLVPCYQRSLPYTFLILALFSVAVLKNKKLREFTFWKSLVFQSITYHVFSLQCLKNLMADQEFIHHVHPWSIFPFDSTYFHCCGSDGNESII